MNKNQRKIKNNRIDTATANQHTKIPHLPLSVALQPTQEPNTRRKGPKSYKDGRKPNANV